MFRLTMGNVKVRRNFVLGMALKLTFQS